MFYFKASKLNIASIKNYELMCRCDVRAMRPGVINDLMGSIIPRDEYGRTPLHYCSYGADDRPMLAVVGKLLQMGGDPNIVDNNGQTIHHLAIIKDRLALMQLLYNKTGFASRNRLDFMGRSPAWYAAQKGNATMLPNLYLNLTHVPFTYVSF